MALFVISVSGLTVQSVIVYGVGLFAMPGMRCVVMCYNTKSLLLPVSCLVLVTMFRVTLLRALQNKCD